jgi:hypothetical protein
MERALFSPLSKRQEDLVKDENALRQRLAAILKVVEPNSCFQQLMEMKRFPQQKVPANPLPNSLKELAQELVDMALGEAIDVLVKARYSDAERIAVELATREQSASPDWFNFRAGMVTASKMKSVVTRMSSAEEDPSINTSSIVSDIMGYKKAVDTKSVRYGRAQEAHGKKLFGKLQKRLHKRFRMEDSGLVIGEHAFIGASPDLVVKCACHGKGLCEIKCSFSIRGSSPSVDNLNYLQSCDSGPTLKKNHQYFFQMQGQMGVCGYTYCYFFVYTCHGYHMEKISFDPSFWQHMSSQIVRFWGLYVAPELITQNVWSQQPSVVEDIGHPLERNDHCYSHKVLSARTVRKAYKPQVTDVLPLPVYLCGECAGDVEDGAVQCDLCKVWFHYGCVGITEDAEPTYQELWLCDKCLSG